MVALPSLSHQVAGVTHAKVGRTALARRPIALLRTGTETTHDVLECCNHVTDVPAHRGHRCHRLPSMIYVLMEVNILETE